MLRISRCLNNQLTDGGEVVSLRHLPRSAPLKHYLYDSHFSPYTGATYTVSNGNYPSLSCSTSWLLFMLTVGPRDQFPRWRRGRRRLSVCSVITYPDLCLQCSASFEHGLKNILFLCGSSFLNRARNSEEVYPLWSLSFVAA
jgi:hypothetical protein